MKSTEKLILFRGEDYWLLDKWPEIDNYKPGDFIYDNRDAYFPWAEGKALFNGAQYWKELSVEDVPNRYKTIALLLS